MNTSLHTYLFSAQKQLKPPHTSTFPKNAKKRKEKKNTKPNSHDSEIQRERRGMRGEKSSYIIPWLHVTHNHTQAIKTALRRSTKPKQAWPTVNACNTKFHVFHKWCNMLLLVSSSGRGYPHQIVLRWQQVFDGRKPHLERNPPTHSTIDDSRHCRNALMIRLLKKYQTTASTF